uniref:(northern house mosquito) hypothetical protein n=1 Tax=Culex pipiens TaxID=7175 RepID=A0A8D8FIK2_CULPI
MSFIHGAPAKQRTKSTSKPCCKRPPEGCGTSQFVVLEQSFLPPLSYGSAWKFASDGDKWVRSTVAGGGRGETTHPTVANDEDSRERYETGEELYLAEAGIGRECGQLSETVPERGVPEPL